MGTMQSENRKAGAIKKRMTLSVTKQKVINRAIGKIIEQNQQQEYL